MPLALKIAKLEDAPEAVRGAYVARDGAFYLDAEIEDTAGLKTAHRKALDEKKKQDDALRVALGDLSLDDAAALIRKQREADDASLGKDKLMEKRLAERDAEWQKKLDAVSPYKGKYEDTVLDTQIRKAALAAGVNPTDLEEFVIPLTKGRRVKLDESGKTVVLDKDGDPTGLSVDKFFAETFKTEGAKFYGASGGSGGGATGGTGGAARLPGGGVAISDEKGFLANVDKIAKGEVKVA